VRKGRSHIKPIGDSGPIRVRNVEGKSVVQRDKHVLPTEKTEQETVIARAFIKTLNAMERTNWQVERLQENDFDFLMHRPGEERLLELQEIMIPRKKRSPYQDREQ
jgi:hypothetical protein